MDVRARVAISPTGGRHWPNDGGVCGVRQEEFIPSCQAPSLEHLGAPQRSCRAQRWRLTLGLTLSLTDMEVDTTLVEERSLPRKHAIHVAM